MNDTDEYLIRCRRLDREYRTIGRDLMRIKVRRASERVGPAAAAKGAIVYSCLFNAACVTMQDTLFLLQAEANEYSATTGSPPITVIGVHEDWLDAGSGTGRNTGHATWRYLWIDDEGVCNDIVLDKPIRIDLVHILHLLPAGEIETHRRLTDALIGRDIIRINPAGAVSDVCDSKHKTFSALRAAGVPTPQTLYFSRFSLSDIAAVADGLSGFVRELDDAYPDEAEHLLFVQPDAGTEARDTIATRIRAGGGPDDSLIDDISSRREDTVVRHSRGNLFYADPDCGNETCRFVIRVNAFEGMSDDELSGYAVVAPGRERDVAAISQGARKLPISSVLERLSDRQGVKVDISSIARQAIYSSAGGAFEAANAGVSDEEKIMLLGIDLVLDIAGERIAACVIDVNPRAVIAHSTFTTGRGEKLGLGLAWWRSLTG